MCIQGSVEGGVLCLLWGVDIWGTQSLVIGLFYVYSSLDRDGVLSAVWIVLLWFFLVVWSLLG